MTPTMVRPLAAFLLFWVAAIAPAAPPAAVTPNVLIPYADDLGLTDLSVMGNREVENPHVDSLASDGVRFSTVSVSACVGSPSRAGLMTGRYRQRFGFDAQAEGGSQRPDTPKGLDLAQETFADRFGALGYATGIVGKWHLGSEMPEFLPNARGFDEFYGLLPHGIGAGKQNAPVALYRATTSVPVPADHTLACGQEAESFIRRHKNRPCLLSCVFTAVHAPYVSEQRFMHRIAHGADPRRRAYLAMLASLDEAIGGILTAIRGHGLEDRSTLVFFASDKGGPGGVAHNGVLRGAKWTLWEGGIHAPVFVRWQGRIPGGRVLAPPAMQIDWLATALAAAGAASHLACRFDGVNLLPLLEGKTDALPERFLFWRFGVQYAVRRERGKLVKATAKIKTAVFDLVADPSETHDLAAADPAKVDELQAIWNAWNAANEPPRWIDERWNVSVPKQSGKRSHKPSSS